MASHERSSIAPASVFLVGTDGRRVPINVKYAQSSPYLVNELQKQKGQSEFVVCLEIHSDLIRAVVEYLEVLDGAASVAHPWNLPFAMERIFAHEELAYKLDALEERQLAEICKLSHKLGLPGLLQQAMAVSVIRSARGDKDVLRKILAYIAVPTAENKKTATDAQAELKAKQKKKGGMPDTTENKPSVSTNTDTTTTTIYVPDMFQLISLAEEEAGDGPLKLGGAEMAAAYHKLSNSPVHPSVVRDLIAPPKAVCVPVEVVFRYSSGVTESAPGDYMAAIGRVARLFTPTTSTSLSVRFEDVSDECLQLAVEFAMRLSKSIRPHLPPLHLGARARDANERAELARFFDKIVKMPTINKQALYESARKLHFPHFEEVAREVANYTSA